MNLTREVFFVQTELMIVINVVIHILNSFDITQFYGHIWIWVKDVATLVEGLH